MDDEQHEHPHGTKVTKHRVTVGSAEEPERQVSFHLLLAVPRGQRAMPAIIRGDLCWGRVRPDIAGEIARRGYVLAEFDRTEIVPDKKGEREVGINSVRSGDFPALAAWAWGFHRVIDYLLTRNDVDPARISVTGHSRGGKAALLAGLMDHRVALTVPNNSGCGGAGCFRHQASGSEDIAAILNKFPYWFQSEFGEFIGKVDRLPIDQHSLKAAIAPRALLTCEALGDLWANPEGTQVTHCAAKEVYDFLGVSDRIGIVFREGKHEQNREDWTALLDFADQLFFAKESTRRFDQLAFSQAPKIWSWKLP